ncbi:DUF1700 domain-containing protein [Candidatus Nomurabacteria bacterium]|nr:DUF1700 domain-containing protein [Candidatus Nomurabacteria bacterium]
MTKNDFLAKLMQTLEERKIAETEDIVSEYEQHFAFKLADGFTEEEIARKLGDPVSIAEQYENVSAGPYGNVNAKSYAISRNRALNALKFIGIVFADIFAAPFMIILFAWQIVMVALSAACAILSVCLVGDLNIGSVLPPIPHGISVIYGIAFAALALLSAVGFVWFGAFVRQLIKSYGRFHHNALVTDEPLPSLPVNPQFSPKRNRRLRTAALVVLIVLIVAVVLAIVISALSAGAVEFWHEWGWFGYTGARA